MTNADAERLAAIELQSAIDGLIRQHGLQAVIDAVSRHDRNKHVHRLPYNERLEQVKALMDQGLTSGDIALRLRLNSVYASRICADVREQEARKKATN